MVSVQAQAANAAMYLGTYKTAGIVLQAQLQLQLRLQLQQLRLQLQLQLQFWRCVYEC